MPSAEYQRQWKARNKKRVSEANARWRKKKFADDPDYFKRAHRKWRKQNIEKSREMARNWARSHYVRLKTGAPKEYAEYLERQRLKQKAYRKKNRTKVLAYAKKYYSENREKCVSDRRKYYRKNKNIFRIKAKQWVKQNPELNRLVHRKSAAKSRYGYMAESFMLLMQLKKELRNEKSIKRSVKGGVVGHTIKSKAKKHTTTSRKRNRKTVP